MSQNIVQSETEPTAPVDLVAKLETDMRNTYLKALRFVESKSPNDLGAAPAPAADIETLMLVLGLLELVDGIANYSSALYQLITLPEGTNASDLKSGILHVFSSETKFCNTLNDLTKKEILTRFGIDSSDTTAVHNFFNRQVANTLVSVPSTQTN